MSASDITSDYDRLLDRMRRACSRREYCSADIRRKLSAAGAPSGLSGKILSSLKSEGYLDDGRYARAYCRDKSGLSGWGEDEALSQIDSDAACRRMDAVLSSKLAEIKRRHPGISRSECLSRLLRFAAGRGYSYGEVMESLKRNKS